ncbi:LOB domain-containing protein 33-like isoform X2 [Zingiber officinale]|uniref:LOB domain-containing protein 33-like isoform X2 n=1 Tax=Zingiber officinale TaxID=94328 RepID=UPI001C4AF5A8|nr:LOB domain-containing protein 33-like isoform X2 [Zingiber officinale]
MAMSSPCGACKFLRRKCEQECCIFAPYFSTEEGATQFAAIHRVFGASKVSKMLLHQVPPEVREEEMATITYEAEARVHDPIYGCVGHIVALQRQLQVMQAKAQLVAQDKVMFSNGTQLWGIDTHTRLQQGHQSFASSALPTARKPLFAKGQEHSMSSSQSSNIINCFDEQSMELDSSSVSSLQQEVGMSDLQALALRMMRK